MKRLSILIITITLLAGGGCKKFLAEQSQNEVRPSTVVDLIQLMAGEGYPAAGAAGTSVTPLCPVLNIMTDDVSCNGGQNQTNYLTVVQKGKAPFTWSKDMAEELLLAPASLSATNINSWENLYKKIAGCNVVLAYADKVEGDAALRENLKGQALAMRAFYYFFLVNLYGQPYNAPGVDPARSPGVPLKLKMDVSDALPARNSVAEVYNQIENDLKEGIALLEANPQNNGILKMNALAAYVLLSRVYLYQEKWDQVIEYTDRVIAQRPGLSQLVNFQKDNKGYFSYNTGITANRIYDQTKSTEILWAYWLIGSNFNSNISGPDAGESAFFPSSVTPQYTLPANLTLLPPYAVSPELIGLYESRPQSDTNTYLADLRGRIYINYQPVTSGATALAYKAWYGGMGGYNGIRVAEAYLNRAEAKIRKFIADGAASLRTEALSDLNTLRIARYDTRSQAYVNIDIADGSTLLSFYKDERRREFPFDGGHRWFDLRRYGMPSITHTYIESGSGQTETLVQGDSRYTLHIPRVVMDRNAALTQNP